MWTMNFAAVWSVLQIQERHRLVFRMTLSLLWDEKTSLSPKTSTNSSFAEVVGQTWWTYLTCCWSLLWWEYHAFKTQLLSADATVTKIGRILNQCYYVEIMQLPQSTSRISIACDYKVIIVRSHNCDASKSWCVRDTVIQMSYNSLPSSFPRGF